MRSGPPRPRPQNRRYRASSDERNVSSRGPCTIEKPYAHIIGPRIPPMPPGKPHAGAEKRPKKAKPRPLFFGTGVDLEQIGAPAETLTKLSGSVRSLIEELLEPKGRERRRRAVRSLNGARTDSSLGIGTPATKPAYRRGWLVATVTDVLRAADGPMQARAIHRAAVELAGEAVSWSSIRNCLASGISGKTPRFERLGYGRYQVVPDANSR